MHEYDSFIKNGKKSHKISSFNRGYLFFIYLTLYTIFNFHTVYIYQCVTFLSEYTVKQSHTMRAKT